MKSTLPVEVLEEVQAQGLSLDLIQLHHKRIVDYIGESHPHTGFSILAPCQRENGRIAALGEEAASPPEGVVAMVLAAGASSRYFQAYEGLKRALVSHDAAEAKQGASHLLADQVCLTPALRVALETAARGQASSAQLQALLTLLELPKALQACTSEGETFLEMQMKRNQALGVLLGQVVVLPANFSAPCEAAYPSPLPTLWEEQGISLSTLRFDPATGEALRDKTGALSLVPAGHGVLLEKFSAIRGRFPQAQSIWIRNIDNLNLREDSNAVALQFMAFHSQLLQAIQKIRAALAAQDLSLARQVAKDVQATFPHVARLQGEGAAFIEAQSEESRSLWALVLGVFQTPLGLARLYTLSQLFARPVNTLGVVRNRGTDVGGAPVVVQSEHGPVALCIEGTHVAESDRSFFEDPHRVTHFNPVYVCAEVVDPQVYTEKSHPYWLLAKKMWHGRPACYHETLLSELLGNSELANMVFVEVPRVVFFPHKSIADTQQN